MEHKTWLWRKRSSEKTIVANDKSELSLEGNEEEVLPTEREVALERCLNNLNEKFASVLCECIAKDDLVANNAKMAQEAIAGREKAEAELVVLKQDLDEALHQRVSSNERVTHLNAALKECMQQLSSVREEQERKVRDAVVTTSKEFEKAQKNLEKKFTETSKRLANLTFENSHLSKALLAKEKLIEDLSKRTSQAEAEFDTLMARLDSTEKENAFLKYEFRMLEKELEIRNEEIEFNRRSADASHKQHLESVKKISKLEAECQRLRVLVRKRLPGPAALAKMKSEVDIQERNHTEMRRGRLNCMTGNLLVRDSTIENPPEIPSKNVSFLIERLCDVEEENKILKEALVKRDDELCSSITAFARTASKLSQAETQLRELSKVQKPMELATCNPVSNKIALTSSFNIGNDDESVRSGSWASAMISELEHFRYGETNTTPECKMIGVSDMSLMDDFVEMEKLAIVAVDAQPGNTSVSSDVGHTSSNSLTRVSCEHHLDSTGKELVPVVQGDSGGMEPRLQISDVSFGKPSDWVQDVLKVILEQNRISKRSLDELLEDIRMALHYMNHPSSKEPESSTALSISGYITWKSPNISPRVGSFKEISDIDTSVEEINNKSIHSSLNSSICKIVELIRRIDPKCSKYYNMPDNWSERDQSTLTCRHSPPPVDYSIHVFRWKSCELSTVLQQFVHTCSDLLDGKINFEKFAGELTSALSWIINNCVTLQDVSSVGDNIKKHIGQDGSQSASEFESGVNGPCIESDTNCVNLRGENEGLKDELKNLKSLRKDLESGQQLANDESEDLTNQLWESEESIGSLRTELETLKESKRMIEDQMENQKLINEDLDTQLSVAKVKYNEFLQKLSSLEVELEDKCHCCEELEATCLELQLQLESVTKKEIRKSNTDQDEKLIQTGWEITAASEKLAECQETILNLGKQLKALASPKGAAVFDRVLSTPSTMTTNSKKLSQRASLLDQMLAEDGVEPEDLKSPKTKEIISSVDTRKPSILHSINCYNTLYDVSNVQAAPPESYLGLIPEVRTAAAGALAIVPSKKRGGGRSLLTKLLLRRKKGSSKKTSLFFAT